MGGAEVQLCVLGPVEVRVDGQIVPIVGKLKHRLLARLALYPGEAVQPDGLIEALWGDSAPRTAKQSLHVHISHIRDRLRPVGADHLITTTTDGNYLLGGSPPNVDAAVFEALVESGAGALQARDHRRAQAALKDAVDMWAEPFESLANHYGAMVQRQRLVAVFERAVDAYVDTLVELGDDAEAVPVLRSAIAAEPLRERPYLQLMYIYERQREPGRARAVYDEVCRVWSEQLGIEPSGDLMAAGAGLPDASRQRVDPSHPPVGNRGEYRVDLDQMALLWVPSGADTNSLVEALRAQATADRRRLVYGRVAESNTSGLSPLLELVGMHDEPGSSRSSRLRAELFDRITQRLITRFSIAPVVVIDGIDLAHPLLFEYLEHALVRPGPDPFTVVALHSQEPAQFSRSMPLKVAELFGPPQKVNLAVEEVAEWVTASLEPDEHAVLVLLACASQPASTELIARASDLLPIKFAEVVERLVARRLLSHEADGHIGLRSPSQVRQRLGLSSGDRSDACAALADAVSARSDLDPSHRAVAEARYRLSALPDAPWELAAAVTLEAWRHLDEIGAYEDIIALADESATAPSQWPPDATTLALWVKLGHAQIRAGRTEAGCATLERAVALARDEQHGTLFAEAVRALNEERAPQRLTDDGRDLISDALAMLSGDVSDTRVQLLTDMASSWYFEDLTETERWANEALALARGGSSATLARALTGFIQAQLRPDNAADRLALTFEAQQAARQADSTESLVLALTYEAGALVELGELRRAIPPLRYAAALAADVQVPRFQWWVASWQALLQFATGELAHAEEAFVAAFEIWPTSTRVDPFECLSAQLAALRFVQGRGAELIPVLDDLVATGESHIEFLAPAALAYAQGEQHGGAQRLLDRMVSPNVLGRCDDIRLPYALALGAEAVALTRDRDSAKALRARIEPLADVHATLNVWGGGGFYWGSLRHGLGLVLDVLGERDEAHAALTLALQHHRLAGVTPFARRTRLALEAMSV